MSAPRDAAIANPSEARSFDPPVVLVVCLCFLLYGAIAAPVPAVNEPHYLCKAKHYWQPEWCANDFFLASSNAHTVLFATIGSLTQWLSLEQTAWIGRILACLVLAAGWCSLMTQLATPRWFALTSCCVFLALQSCGNFSGEWLVGGVEGKTFCYGFFFASRGEVLRGRTIAAGALAGLAIAFHPVVGVWGVLSLAGAALWEGGRRSAKRGATVNYPSHPQPPGSSACRVLPSALAVVALLIVALPGLIPVFRLLAEPVPASTKFAANYIQVYYRLSHHLDPMQFHGRAYLGYAALIVVWLLLTRKVARSDSRRFLNQVVGFAILFAVAGLLIGYGPRPASQMPYFALRAQLLKFYPFRLADVLVPLAVSIALASWWGNRGGQTLRLAGFSLLFAAALWRAHSIVEVNRYSGELRADWLDACRWIDGHLPADAVVQAPHNGWAFKWFARRAEYVSFKDCPQDAAGIVEWNRRLNFLKKWYEDQYADQFYSVDELRDLRRQTGITHLLTDRLGPLAIEPTYRNATFQVYDLTALDR